ncbi:MAG: hypothetical protein ACKOWF_16340, partial [Chloroflexota bacterium]
DVGYHDQALHLHENLYAVRDGAVVGIWPTLARGGATGSCRGATAPRKPASQPPGYNPPADKPTRPEATLPASPQAPPERSP